MTNLKVFTVLLLACLFSHTSLAYYGIKQVGISLTPPARQSFRGPLLTVQYTDISSKCNYPDDIDESKHLTFMGSTGKSVFYRINTSIPTKQFIEKHLELEVTIGQLKEIGLLNTDEYPQFLRLNGKKIMIPKYFVPTFSYLNDLWDGRRLKITMALIESKLVLTDYEIF